MKQLLLGSVLTLFATHSVASEMVYTPINPSFGGHPNNGGYLMSNAQAQNDTKSSSSSGYTAPSDLDRFTSSLESRLLSQLLSDIGNGTNTNGGVLETEDFIITINQEGGLTVTTLDKHTGESTTISVGLDQNP